MHDFFVKHLADALYCSANDLALNHLGVKRPADVVACSAFFHINHAELVDAYGCEFGSKRV